MSSKAVIPTLCFAFFAGVFGEPFATATTYLAVKFGDTIVVGADSCSTLTIDKTRHVPGPSVCKIHECAPNTYFVYAGTLINISTGIRFDQIVRRACSQGGAPLQVMARIRNRLVDSGRRAYGADKQAVVLAVAIFGTSKKGAFLLSRAVTIRQDGLHEDPIDDCLEDCKNRYVMGGYQKVMKRLINVPGFWDRNGLDEGVRVLLTEEIKADVTHEIAFPLSIIEVSTKGARWVEEGLCLPKSEASKQARH
jgi:hypothetical protein